MLRYNGINLIFLQKCSVYDICFSPDGNQMVAAVGFRVLVINVAEGTIIQTLKGNLI